MNLVAIYTKFWKCPIFRDLYRMFLPNIYCFCFKKYVRAYTLDHYFFLLN